MLAYALTIFIGAFLLFLVQPLVAKYILPWFGGGPGVWTTCLLVFQSLLLAGYAYAHALARWSKPRAQVAIHLLFVFIALAALPIIPADHWKPRGGENPILKIVMLLGATVGLPYLVLSATSPLLQSWFSRAHPGRSPYRLYALSNVGSLLALLSYPFVLEPHFSRRQQANAWMLGMAMFSIGCAWCGWKLWKATRPNDPPGRVVQKFTASSPPTFSRFLWLLWPACASALLLASTNKICQDVAVVPFLWVLPLALYLLSFIICFDHARWYRPHTYAWILALALAGLCWVMFQGSGRSVKVQIAVYCLGLFVCCLVCHGELYRLKPEPGQLTGFYLMIALGGALGGIFVAVIAPVIFTSFYEIYYGLFLCGALFVIARVGDPAAGHERSWRGLALVLMISAFVGLDWLLRRAAAHSSAPVKSTMFQVRMGVWIMLGLMVLSWVARRKFRDFVYWKALACAWLWLGLIALGVTLWLLGRRSNADVVYRSRNFYGTLTVFEHDRGKPADHHFLLQHGRITHGIQLVDGGKADWATSYYGEESGIGRVMQLLPSPKRIGVVGLGTGTIAVYADRGDHLRFYEIDPAVKQVAGAWFTYLAQCPAAIDVVLGDARLSMETEPRQSFDLLALDAFSSDAIPTHLLTREAFVLYSRHLAEHGVIAVHISNRYIDLEPVVTQLAREFRLFQAVVDYDAWDNEWWLYSNIWILLTRTEPQSHIPGLHWRAPAPSNDRPGIAVWSDDFASLFPLLK